MLWLCYWRAVYLLYPICTVKPSKRHGRSLIKSTWRQGRLVTGSTNQSRWIITTPALYGGSWSPYVVLWITHRLCFGHNRPPNSIYGAFMQTGVDYFYWRSQSATSITYLFIGGVKKFEGTNRIRIGWVGPD